MPTIPRFLDVRVLVERKSCFLFGPRQTGKSTLIGQQFADCRTWNLLDQELFRRLSRNPGLIRESLAEGSGSDIVVIDEIQRMPELLNEVHLMIEEHGARFLLTGSSARALRRKGVNLLGGRAGRRSLHPLVDFVFADVAVEVKAARAVGGRHLKGLRALAEEKLLSRHILVSMDPYPRVVDGILLLPWEEFLDRLWDGKLAAVA